MSILGDYRVIELADERRSLQVPPLGAEVITVEPPGGSHSRRLDHLQMTSCRRILRYGIGRTTEEKSVVLI